MNDNFEFEDDSIPDEETIAELDNFIDALRELMKNSKSSDAIINPKRAKDVLFVYNDLKHFSESTDVKVTYRLNEPFRCSGSASAVGKTITFRDSEWFREALKLATNFNVYPKTDGTVRLDFTFYDLAIPINKKER